MPQTQIIRTKNLPDSQAKRLRRTGSRLTRGVYLAASQASPTPSLIHRALAALSVCPPGTAICDITVLALAGVAWPEDMTSADESPVHVVVPRLATSWPKRPEIIVHRESAPAPTWRSARGGLTGVSLAPSWAQVTARLLRAGPVPSLPTADSP